MTLFHTNFSLTFYTVHVTISKVNSIIYHVSRFSRSEERNDINRLMLNNRLWLFYLERGCDYVDIYGDFNLNRIMGAYGLTGDDVSRTVLCKVYCDSLRL